MTTRPLRILLVEDEPLIALTLADLVEELGHLIVEAASASEGLEAFRSHPDIDVLVTDIGLPDMQGDELARQCRQLRADLPVLFVTGHVVPLPGQEETEDPPTARLTKPYQLNDLDRALRRIVRRP